MPVLSWSTQCARAAVHACTPCLSPRKSATYSLLVQSCRVKLACSEISGTVAECTLGSLARAQASTRLRRNGKSLLLPVALCRLVSRLLRAMACSGTGSVDTRCKTPSLFSSLTLGPACMARMA